MSPALRPLVVACASLVFVGVAAAQEARNWCGGCRVEREAAELCSVHAKADREGLRTWQPRFRAGQAPTDRMEALRGMARLTFQHTNAPSAKVADALARGLEDDAIEVRLLTQRLLLDGQHRARTTQHLTAALSRARVDLVRGRKLVERALAAGSAAELEPRERERLRALPTWVEGLLGAVATLDDERAVDALATFAKGRPAELTAGVLESCARAACATDSVDGVAAAIELLARTEQAAARGELAATPAELPADPALASLAYGWAPPGASAPERLVRVLEAAARGKGLSEFPAPGADAAKRWKKWLGKQRGSFRTKLGRAGALAE